MRVGEGSEEKNLQTRTWMPSALAARISCCSAVTTGSEEGSRDEKEVERTCPSSPVSQRSALTPLRTPPPTKAESRVSETSRESFWRIAAHQIRHRWPQF